MKKVLLMVAMALVMVLSGALAVSAAPKGIDFNGAHFNLNLIGKAKTMPGDYNNPDRHTMFVPTDTSDFSFNLNTPNNLDQETMAGVKINMTQGSEFAVLDGNATDGEGSFQLGPGKYRVYIAVKAKMPKTPGNVQIDGWVEAYDNLGQLWYYINVGTVTVSKNKTWTDASTLFYVNTTEDTFDFLTGSEANYEPGLGMWVFDYMAGLDAWVTDDYNLSDLAYFWQFQNDGAKLIQVRFYPVN
ncbi:hypothetical protein [Dehalogenimonas formicexedens]|uniref:hypothetical protein n=1 Tax=Dehalogenimonas formicexedens TaxID=1839801 RepID=UPI00096B9D5D|nr:hypothetical protein [Dehalogenimonas formicexedens]